MHQYYSRESTIIRTSKWIRIDYKPAHVYEHEYTRTTKVNHTTLVDSVPPRLVCRSLLRLAAPGVAGVRLCLICDAATSLSNSFTHSLTHTRTHVLNHSVTHSVTLSLTHSLPHSLTHSLTHSHSLTYALTHSLIHSLTHALTHPRGRRDSKVTDDK